MDHSGKPAADAADSFGRRFSYLRLSITDVCGFRCQYCLPNGYQRGSEGAKRPLDPEEIHRLVTAFSELGLWKVRITGGEPTARRDFIDVVQAISSVPGIRKVALTTNGPGFLRLAEDAKRAGLHAVNISIDSLKRERFAQITGMDRLPEVLKAVDRALELGYDPVKVNTVLLKDLNDGREFEQFIEWIKVTPTSVRLIELMQTGDNLEYFKRHHLRAEVIQERLLTSGWKIKERAPGDGPAREFVHSGFKGRIGLIAPYSKDFCASCNRLRMTSLGQLKLCLFGTQNYPLRQFLRANSQKEELKAAVLNLLGDKKISHFLHAGNFGNTRNLSAFGG